MVTSALSGAQARLHLLGRLQALGPGALAASILVQLALLPGSPSELCALGAILAAGWGLARAARLLPPSQVAVGTYLDARLGGGAVLAAAAEALDGAHVRFREPLVREAAERLRQGGERASVPWRLSPAWALALAATALSPLSLSSAPPPPGPSLGSRSLLDPSLLGAGGAGAPGSLATAPADAGTQYGASAGSFEEDTAPLELPLDVAAALAEAAGPPPGGGGASGASQSTESGSDPILASAAEGGLEQALRELEQLQSAAQGGDRAARVRLDRLREALAKASGGGGGSAGSAAGAKPLTASPGASGGGSRAGVAELPPALAGTLQRYFGG